MMCYRDRTYCDAPCAVGPAAAGRALCSRFVTDEVRAAADRAGLPLALSDFRDTCPRFVRAALRPEETP